MDDKVPVIIYFDKRPGKKPTLTWGDIALFESIHEEMEMAIKKDRLDNMFGDGKTNIIKN